MVSAQPGDKQKILLDMLSLLPNRRKNGSALPFWLDAALGFFFIALFAALIAIASLFLGLIAMKMPQPVLDVDLGIVRLLAGHTSDWLAVIIFTFFNDPGIDYSVVVAACLGYVWVKQRRNTVAALAALCLALSVSAWSIPYSLWFGYRPRPFALIPDLIVNPYWQQVWASYPSFPSGHIRELTGLSVVLVHYWPSSRWIVLAYGGFLAFSRLYIGAHFPSDLLGGAIIGLMCGGFAVYAVERGNKILSTLAKSNTVKGIYDLLTKEGHTEPGVRHPNLLRLVRCSLYSLYLFAATFAVGSLLFIDSSSLLGDYLHSTDSTLVGVVFGRFDSSVAQFAYAFFVNPYFTLTGLVVLYLASYARVGRRALGQAIVSTALAGSLSCLLDIAFSSYFVTARPFTFGNPGLPEIWRTQWPLPGHFPDAYLLVVEALSVLLASRWTNLRFPIYLYPFMVAVSLSYFGAAWPIASLATLMLGYLVGRYSLYICREILPVSR